MREFLWREFVFVLKAYFLPLWAPFRPRAAWRFLKTREP